MTSRRWRFRDGVATVTGLAAVFVLSACAQIPTSGPIIEGPTPNNGNSRVRIDPQPPGAGAGPVDIVNGFLDAMSSYQLGFPIARRYLAPRVTWDSSSIVVYAGPEQVLERPVEEDAGAAGDGTTVTFTAPKVATIDPTGHYAAATPGEEVVVDIGLTKVDGQWRISIAPDTLLISTVERDASYSQFVAYYPSSDGNVMVPDPIWLPSTGVETSRLLAEQLVDGPTAAVVGGVDNAFPVGTRVVGVTVTGGLARVDLSSEGAAATAARRMQMLAQLAFTLQQTGATSIVGEVDGSSLVPPVDALGGVPVDNFDALDAYAPFAQPRAYAIVDGRVVTIDPQTGRTSEAPGPAGQGATPGRSLAVSLTGRSAATVSPDGRSLQVVSFNPGAAITVPWAGSNVSRPSWDRYGNIWFADRGPNGSQLRVVAPTGGTPVEVSAPQLAGLTVLAVRVAVDAARVAFVVEGPDLAPSLLVGWVRWSNGVPVVGGLTNVAPQVVDVRDVGWSGPTDLAVIGNVAGRFAEVAVVSVDGSRINETVQSGAAFVAAYSDEPLLAITSDESLLLQITTTNWSTVAAATAVAYPG